MIKYLIILFFLTACHGFKNSQDENWRKYFVSELDLREGYVKRTVIHNSQGDIVYYDKVFLDNEKIILRRFDSNYEIVREDVNIYNSDRMQLIKATYYFKGFAVPVRIIKPTIAPYKPTKEVLVSELEYSPTDFITISIVSKAKYLANVTYSFRSKKVDCLKFSYDESYKLTNKKNPAESFDHIAKGFSLWGEDIGLIYMKFKDQSGESEYIVDEILTIAEFDQMKL